MRLYIYTTALFHKVICLPLIPSTIFIDLYNNHVHLSLLIMTNPNQIREVLLFVCSKMADETNLSSKLPVADSTREV